MTNVILKFELAEEASGDTLAEELRIRIAKVDAVGEVETQVNQSRGIAEAIVIVAAGVTLLDHGTEFAVSLKNFVKAVKEVMVELGLDRAFMQVRGQKLDLATVTDEEIERL